MSIQEAIKSNTFRVVALVIGVLVITLASFAAGLNVGFHKARYSYQWGENYERNFMGPGRGRMPMDGMGRGYFGPMGDDPGADFRNGHGLAGAIVSINDNKIVVKDREEKENTITVSDQTVIKYHRDTIKINELKTDDQVVVMGKPGDDGTIQADIIRVFDK